MVEVAVALDNVNLDLLTRYGYKYTQDETHCLISCKCFSGSGAEDCMIAERLSKCLNLEDCGHVKIRSILDGKAPIKKLKRISLYIKIFGKVNFYIKGEIPKNALTSVHRKIIMDNFGLDNTRLKDFSLDNHTLEQPISLPLGIQLGLEQESVKPELVELFDSPILPNLKIIKNPINNISFASKMGGRYSDF